MNQSFHIKILIWTTIHLNSDSTGQIPVKYRHFNSKINFDLALSRRNWTSVTSRSYNCSTNSSDLKKSANFRLDRNHANEFRWGDSLFHSIISNENKKVTTYLNLSNFAGDFYRISNDWDQIWPSFDTL